MERDLARYAPDSRQICVPGLDAEPLRNSLSGATTQFESSLAILRIALDQKVEGSNPSSPANTCPPTARPCGVTFQTRVSRITRSRSVKHQPKVDTAATTPDLPLFSTERWMVACTNEPYGWAP
jgi:hypothetical protein